LTVTHQSSSLVFTWKRHHFLFPDWQRDYESAFCEADDAELFKKVEVAEAAMLTRRDALPGGVENRAEWQSLEDALADVCALKKNGLRNKSLPLCLTSRPKQERLRTPLSILNRTIVRMRRQLAKPCRSWWSRRCNAIRNTCIQAPCLWE
jgi:hypothetical protein